MMDQEWLVFFIVAIHAVYLVVFLYRKKFASLLAHWALKKQRVKWAMFFRSHSLKEGSRRKPSCH